MLGAKEKWNALIKSTPPQWERKISLNDWLFLQEMEQIAKERGAVNGGHEPPRYCRCDELLLNGKRLPCPPQHDCDYTRQRSALVKTAQKLASEKIPFDPYASGEEWTKCFCAVMEELSLPLLRQSDNGTHERKAV